MVIVLELRRPDRCHPSSYAPMARVQGDLLPDCLGISHFNCVFVLIVTYFVGGLLLQKVPSLYGEDVLGLHGSRISAMGLVLGFLLRQ